MINTAREGGECMDSATVLVKRIEGLDAYETLSSLIASQTTEQALLLVASIEQMKPGERRDLGRGMHAIRRERGQGTRYRLEGEGIIKDHRTAAGLVLDWGLP